MLELTLGLIEALLVGGAALLMAYGAVVAVLDVLHDEDGESR